MRGKTPKLRFVAAIGPHQNTKQRKQGCCTRQTRGGLPRTMQITRIHGVRREFKVQSSKFNVRDSALD
jgi:hypothetical protein